MTLTSSDVIDSFDKKKLLGNDGDSSDSDFSYDSDASDGTFIPSSCDESFETAYSGASSVFIPSPETSLLGATNAVVKKEIKYERPLSRVGHSNTPTVPIQSPYNLRSRSSLRSSGLNDSIIKTESSEAFGSIVKQMERITRHNAQKIVESAKKIRSPSYYSSDDDL